MTALATAVALFAALSLINLLLTLGLVRRVRQAQGMSPQSSAGHAQPAGSNLPVPGISPGAPLPLGDHLGYDGRRPLLVGFFSSGCKACPDHIEPFRAYARDFPGDVVAVLDGQDAPAKYAPGLGADIRTISNVTKTGTVSNAIDLHAWPSFIVVDGTGRVHSTALSVSALDPTAPPAIPADTALATATAGSR